MTQFHVPQSGKPIRLLAGAFSFVLFAAISSIGLLPSAYAADMSVSDTAPDLSSARTKIKAKDWKGAIEELTKMTVTNQHADVYNLLGFSLRKSGDYKNALFYYQKALDLDPKHRGAQEYLGELYVETGQMEKAKAMLASLEKLCPEGCEEREDLENAIAAGPGHPAKPL